MIALRRRLRRLVAAWLVFQAATLSAFVPKDCCAAHEPAAYEQESACHDVPVDDPPCTTADGRACPMHHAPDGSAAAARLDDNAAGAAEAGEDEAPSPCTLRNACQGPMAALASYLSNQGVLPGELIVSPRAGVAPAPVAAPARPLRLLHPPDSPPPRV